MPPKPKDGKKGAPSGTFKSPSISIFYFSSSSLYFLFLSSSTSFLLFSISFYASICCIFDKFCIMTARSKLSV
jgi:hypothetical protein